MISQDRVDNNKDLRYTSNFVYVVYYLVVQNLEDQS